MKLAYFRFCLETPELMLHSNISQLIHSHSLNHSFENYTTKTASDTQSTRSISDPNCLIEKAVTELRNGGNLILTGKVGDSNSSFSEYWDTWMFWHRHPFLQNQPNAIGQITLENILIISNVLEAPETSDIRKGLGDKLELLREEMESWIKLMVKDGCDNSDLIEQVCAAFFIFLCPKSIGTERTLAMLERSKDSIPLTLCNSLRNELAKYTGQEKKSKITQYSICLLDACKSFSGRLYSLSGRFHPFLQALYAKHSFLFCLIQSNPHSFSALLLAIVSLIGYKLAFKRIK